VFEAQALQVVEPDAGANVPALQASHCEPPVVPLYVPGGQLVQVLETAAATVPAAQVLQLVEPATAELPAAQLTQAEVAPGEYLPPSQLVHLVEPVTTV